MKFPSYHSTLILGAFMYMSGSRDISWSRQVIEGGGGGAVVMGLKPILYLNF